MKRLWIIVLVLSLVAPWVRAGCALVVGRTFVFNINGQRTIYSGAVYDTLNEEQKANSLMDMIETLHRAVAECDDDIPVYEA